MVAACAALVGMTQADIVQTLHNTTAWQSLGIETIGNVNTSRSGWWDGLNAKTTTNNGVFWSTDGGTTFDNTDFEFDVGETVDFQVFVFKEYAGGHQYDALRVWMDSALVVDGETNNDAIFSNNEWSASYGPNTKIDQLFAPVEFSYTFGAVGDYDLTARVTCSNDLSQLNNPYNPGWGIRSVSERDWDAFNPLASFVGGYKNGQGETEKYTFHVANVPEPTLISLLGCGLLGLLFVRRRK